MGFCLATKLGDLGRPRRLIEVYPHVALPKLLSAPYRLQYKAAKVRRYWPVATPEERIDKLRGVWKKIWRRLSMEIFDLPQRLTSVRSVRTLAGLKRYEDALDALVSAWVGAKFLEARVRRYGDDTAAIWVPSRSLCLDNRCHPDRVMDVR